jgi:hypothetical protein
MTREELVETLSKHDCEVTFTKVDGAVRVMPCTLRTEAMPVRESQEHHSTKLFKPEVLSVWCLDRSEWRSFRVANVTGVKILG